jgi:hypothetical protein
MLKSVREIKRQNSMEADYFNFSSEGKDMTLTLGIPRAGLPTSFFPS